MRTEPRIASFLRCERGIAAIEFGLALPVLLTLVYGVIEITRYVLISQKVEKLAHTTADLVAQSATVDTAGLDQVLDAAAHIMRPHAMGENSRVIISSLYRAAGNSGARVNWCYRGGGSLASASAIGELNAVPAMPGGFTFNERENVISAEVFYRFAPLITTQFFEPLTIYRAAFYKPRLGALTTASVSCG